MVHKTIWKWILKNIKEFRKLKREREIELENEKNESAQQKIIKKLSPK